MDFATLSLLGWLMMVAYIAYAVIRAFVWKDRP